MMDGATPVESNKQYTTTGNGTFTAATTGDEMYYPMDGSTVGFIAYYPYESGADLSTPVSVTIGNQDDQPSFDLLYSSGATSFDGGNEYAYAVTITRTGVVFDGRTISPWITLGNDRGPVTAE